MVTSQSKSEGTDALWCGTCARTEVGSPTRRQRQCDDLGDEAVLAVCRRRRHPHSHQVERLPGLVLDGAASAGRLSRHLADLQQHHLDNLHHHLANLQQHHLDNLHHHLAYLQQHRNLTMGNDLEEDRRDDGETNWTTTGRTPTSKG